MIKLALLSLISLFTNKDDSGQPYVISYIEEYKYLAIDEMVRTGIPASIILGQAIIESNAGVSNLALRSNNHFGIKCKDYWDGNKYYHPDDDRNADGKIVPSCFRKYETVKDSYVDHSNFLMNSDHYKPLFTYDKTEYKLWAQGLALCGYASCEKYDENLIRIIELYNLHELDYYTIQYVNRSELSATDEDTNIAIKK